MIIGILTPSYSMQEVVIFMTIYETFMVLIGFGTFLIACLSFVLR
ncbi:putative holin-like toxin [Amphibacillus jilinensis]